MDGSPLDPPSPPHIQPPYYGGLVITNFVGRSGASKLVELTVNDTNVSGYAAFEGDHLVRAVFINLNAWLSDSTGTRPSTHIDLSFVSDLSGNSTTENAEDLGLIPTARRLIIDHADDVSNLTFGGQSYETADVHPTGRVVRETVNLNTGIDLRATEAILIDF